MIFVSNKTRLKWRPTLTLLRSGITSFQGAPVSWRFIELSIPKIPMAFVECRLTYAGIEAVGLGDSLTFKNATIKALAEAWERAWMHKLYASGRIEIKSSNGFAAGSTSEAALLSAQAECAERAIFLLAWEQQRGWERLEFVNIAVKVFLTILSQRGWTTSFYKIDGGTVGLVVAGLSLHPKFGAVFDTKFVGVLSEKTALTGLARSLLRMAVVQERIEIDSDFALPNSAAPFDHMKFYRDPGNLKAFAFLDDFEASRSLDFDSGKTDQTHSVILCDVSNLPAVAYSYNSWWPVLQWGLQSVRGKNKWPHPLA